jgi:hypothetical protein
MNYRRSQLGRRIELLESRRMLAPVFRVQDNFDDGDITDVFSLSWAIEGKGQA